MLPSIELTEAYLERLSDKAEQLSDLDDVITEVERAIEPLKKLKTGFPAAMMVKDLIVDARFMQDLIYEQRHAISQLLAEKEKLLEVEQGGRIDLSIVVLHLNDIKAVNALRSVNINTLMDLTRVSESYLQKIPAIKPETLDKIKSGLGIYGLKLKD
ncbi:TPA: DNA-directed RNA polymerase subunit alpha C-terminal domain-containing protein [Neisseria subflava]